MSIWMCLTTESDSMGSTSVERLGNPSSRGRGNKSWAIFLLSVVLYSTEAFESHPSCRDGRGLDCKAHGRASTRSRREILLQCLSVRARSTILESSERNKETFTNRFEDDLDHQAAARADRDLLALVQIVNSDLESVAARARIMVDLEGGIEGHVLDFYLIVDRHVERLLIGLEEAVDVKVTSEFDSYPLRYCTVPLT